MTTDRLAYRVTEAAERIGISRTKCYELIKAGKLPSVRIGGSVRVPVDALKQWIQEHMQQSA